MSKYKIYKHLSWIPYFKKKLINLEYLHFLASTGNHSQLYYILSDDNYDNEGKLRLVVNWCNEVMEERNRLNKNHGFPFLDKDTFEKNFKIYKYNDTYRLGRKEKDFVQ